MSTYKSVTVKAVGKSFPLLLPVRYIRRKMNIPSLSSIYVVITICIEPPEEEEIAPNGHGEKRKG